MKSIIDKYNFKNIVKRYAGQLSIDPDFFDSFFANVFMEIFDKEKHALCVLNKLEIDLTKIIINEISKIDKKNKADFLLLFEDYQKINSELDEMIINIKKDCASRTKLCKQDGSCVINLSHYPMLCERTHDINLKTFRPEHKLTEAFLEFIETLFGQYGVFFLYSLEKELMYIGSGENLGSRVLEAIWEKNIDGYVSVAFTKSMADMMVYEPYYIRIDKPLLNKTSNIKDTLSLELPLLEKTGMVRIYEK